MNDRHGYGYGVGTPNHPPTGPAPHGHHPPSRPRAPGAVTGIAAAVLAMIAGIVAAVTAVVSVLVVADVANDDLTDSPEVSGLLIVIHAALAAASGFVALIYLLGATLLFARVGAGRVLVIIASVLGVAIGIPFLGLESGAVTIAVCALCVSTLVAASLPATGRWIAARKYPR